MAIWTDILLNVFDSGKPTNGVNVKQISENITALAEGAEGAPRIQAVALADDLSGILATPEGGASTYRQKRIGTVDVTPNTSEANIGWNGGREMTTVLRTGTIRFKFTHSVQGSLTTAETKIYANGVLIHTGFVDGVNDDEIDFYMAQGTVVYCTARRIGGGAFSVSAQVFTSNLCSLVVA